MKKATQGGHGPSSGDYPVTREDFGVPEELYGTSSREEGDGYRRAEDSVPPEDTAVVPDYVMPGEYPKTETPARKKKGRTYLRGLFYLSAAAVLLFSPIGFRLGAAGAENEQVEESVPVPAETPVPTEAPASSPAVTPAAEEEADDPDGPRLVIVYATRDAGGIVEYAYYPYMEQDYFPVTVETAVKDAAGGTAVREGDPETWYMFRSAGFDYTVDASALAPGDLTLCLTMRCTKDGKEIEKTFTSPIVDKPHELTAEITLTSETQADGSNLIHYLCYLTPAPDETVKFDFEVIDFAVMYYNRSGERIFGIANLSGDGRNPEVRRSQTGDYFVEVDGTVPAELIPGDAAECTVYMELRDNTTGFYPFVYESDPVPIEEPYEEPAIDPVLICFSSSIEGSIFVTGNAETVTSCTYELWEPFTDTMIREADVTEEAKTGRVILEPYELGDFYFEHQAEFDAADTWPQEAEIRVSMTYETREGRSVTVTKTQKSSYELGFGIRYVPSTEDVSPEDYEWRGKPGNFKIGLYESPEEVEVLSDMPEEAIEENMMSFRLTVDGEEIPVTEYSSMTSTEEFTDGAGGTQTWYYVTVFLPMPEKYPENEGHVATISVTQYLKGYDRVYTTERVIEY